MVLECDWNKVLPLYNSIEERNRVTRINRNLRIANYPLTRNFLNSHFNQSDWSMKSSFNYDCAASMYSYFIMSFGKSEGGASSNFPVPTGAGVSTGYNIFNPFGFDLDILPGWLWFLILGVVGIWVYDKVK